MSALKYACKLNYKFSWTWKARGDIEKQRSTTGRLLQSLGKRNNQAGLVLA